MNKERNEKRLTIRIPVSMFDSLVEVAESSKISISELIRGIIGTVFID